MRGEWLFQGYVSKWMPVALVLLLTGMFWLWDRADYHKLYYATVALPTLVVMVVCAGRFLELLRAPFFAFFATFALYVSVSSLWSEQGMGSAAIKHPLYVALLMIAVAVSAQYQMRRVVNALLVAGGLAVVAGAASTVRYVFEGADDRFTGYGALYNPLLSSHVYGFFAAFWLASAMTSSEQRPLKTLIFIGLTAILFLTGSRTPFLALVVCFAWLALVASGRRMLWVLIGAGALALVGAFFFGEELLARGLSYRPYIWAQTWQQSQPELWFGKGFDTPIDILVPQLDVILADPHNLTLAVIYETGLVGAVLWLALYGYSFISAWRLRKHGLVVISSTLLIYGFMAGMTEGGSFMSRPKEHWFIVWIPLALHFGVLLKLNAQARVRVQA